VNDSQLLEIARNQKRILWLILLSVPVVAGVLFVPASNIAMAVIVPAVLIGIVGTALIFRLARGLEARPWCYVVSAFIPYVSIVALLIINYKATAALKRGGIRVGLMGADKDDLKNLVMAVQPHSSANGGQSAPSETKATPSAGGLRH
jgi:hypothetical protein